ncbi:LPS export ABC transporter periplasmic protein LptC [Janthinobacterium sp. 17J80-10]|uniref:LPS export ABC transporter periplasmic protein LptC n=1 Tax=Janthinobacterium sp. 17J80-10 TaxID=2497863 RepID=UPI00100591B5|nr:LPS export ABC transporter periplasmic protein LptC [Janthinobacterium sp. 17J80-10]QAU35847.1 LPS export ABC transporter periplasmic protein LptC [Janthinobacterium sp. 17J80-10]
MKDRRAAANRFQLGLVLALAALLALGSFWLLDVMRRGIEDSLPAVQRTEPDYYVERFNFVRLAKTGEARYHIAGERMTHNPQDDSYEIARPVMKALSAKRPTTTIVAERALANSDMSQVRLFNNVKMERPASTSSRHLRLISEYMLVLPDDDTMKTDRPVELVSGTTVLYGTGMFANHATGEFSLASKVRGTLQPRMTQ